MMIQNPSKTSNGNTMKILIREFWRSLKQNFTRFLSIVFIIALGVGFFAGINATKPDMIKSATQYYNVLNLMDLRSMNPLGYRPEDIRRLAAVEGIDTLQPSHTKDLLMKKDDQELVVRLYSLDYQNYGPDTINQFKLLEGRMPQKSGEIVLAPGKYFDTDLSIGDTVRFQESEDRNLSEIMVDQDYTVVGFIESPLYVTIERERTNIGNGSIETYVYVPEEDFTSDPTEFFITVLGAENYSPEAQEYKDAVLAVQERVEALGEEIMTERTRDLKAELEENRDTLEKERADVEKQLDDARAELNQAEQDLVQGEATLVDEEARGRQEIEDGRAELLKAREDLLKGRLEYNEGYLKWQKGQTEYLAAKAKLDAAKLELAQGKAELDAARIQLDQGKAMLEENKATLESSREQIETFGAIVEGLNEVRDSIPDTPTLTEAEYEEILAGIEAVSPELAETIRLYIPYTSPDASEAIRNFIDTSLASVTASYESAKAAFDAGQAQFDAASRDLEEGEKEYARGLKEYKAGKAELDAASKEMDAAGEELSDAKSQLDEARKELDDGDVKIAQGELALEVGLKELETRVAEGWEELEKGKEDLAAGKAEFKKQEQDALKQLQEADDKLLDAQRQILDIPDHWFVTTRDGNPGYTSWYDSANSIGQVAIVFPGFFFLVAALVSLTTITRMVEEERTQSGTLKALGYTSSHIAAKYISYALMASLMGSALGLVIGFNLFPRVIIWAYQMMYNIPASVIEFNWFYALTSIGIAILATVGAAFAAVLSEIRERPATLIQPKAPPEGKTILLERITPFWSRLSFSRKVAFRNLFRYKKRFWMTVLGISGCTALMMAGFGIKDSVDAIVGNQFRELFIYDQMIMTDKNKPQSERAFDQILDGNEDIKSWGAAQFINVNVQEPGSNRTHAANLVVPENPGSLSNFIVLRNRVTQEALPLTDGGVIINEKLAELSDLKIGDEITYQDSENREFQTTVTGIAENYMSNYIYITPSHYEAVHFMKPDYDTAWVQLTDQALANEAATTETIMAKDAVLTVVSSREISDNFDDQMASLSYVVVVLIISAAALAFIVLYNLSNVNITERVRELATIKVLGFHDREVSAYINRENIILTVIGGITGLGLGVILHRFIINTMEIDNMMFGKIITWPSYLWSLLLTFLFSAIVSFIMHFALKRIDMVESLKSLE